VRVDVHFYFHAGDSTDTGEVVDALAAIMTRLTSMETQMSDTNAALDGLTAAVADVATRVGEDFAHMQDLLAQMSQTAVDDQAEIDRLMAEASDVAARVNEQTTRLTSIDPLTDFPPAPAPEPEPTPEPAPEPTPEPTPDQPVEPPA
jgi:ABC-type transporter Mla subunit MlaD